VATAEVQATPEAEENRVATATAEVGMGGKPPTGIAEKEESRL